MSTHNLKSFLDPASVALVGASRRPGSVGGVASRNLELFPGRVFRVNRHLEPDAVAGIYPAVSMLPEAPELAIVAVPAAGVPAVIEDLVRLGTKAAVVLSAGFAETSAGAQGKILEAEMLSAARRSGMRILGPNCLGMLAPRARLNAGFAQCLPKAGPIAFLSQSGALLTTVIDWSAERSIGYSALVSLGDMSEVDVADWLDYLADDPHTGAILLYLESIREARKFMSAARLAARLKPLIVLKAGRAFAGARAAASHTGALAGRDEVFDAALHRAGALRVPTLMQMLEAAETLAHGIHLEGDRLALLTNGGGLGVLAADQLSASRGTLAPLSEATVAKLDEFLPPGWSHGNPVDLLGDADAERYRAALEILLEAPEADAVAVMNCPTGLADSATAAQGVLTAAACNRRRKPILAAWLGPTAGREAAERLEAAGIPNFQTPEALVRGFMQLAERRRQLEFLSRTVPAFPLRGAPDRGRVRELVDAALGKGETWLDEAAAKELLGAAGLPVNATRRARTPKEARAAAAQIEPPYAVKILSPDLLHKSDVGGVALNVESPEEVGRVAERMIARLHERYPEARLAGVSVQHMVERGEGSELIAGLTLDPVFGPVILFGAGGVAVEAIDDTALTLPPLDVNLARELVTHTRIHRVLEGAKGRLQPADLDALYAVLIRLSELICEFPEITDLDLNPLLATPRGVTILDARIKLQPATGAAIARLAIVPYPRELEVPFELPDGTRCVLRPIRAEDESSMRRAFERLSPRSRYFRLGDSRAVLPHDMAARATQIDYDREMAFVIAEDKPSGEASLFGGVRLVCDANRERGEFAITVLDEYAGKGIGRRLMQRLIEYGRTIGVREIYGYVMRVNAPMLALCNEFGFVIEPCSDDPTLVEACIKLS